MKRVIMPIGMCLGIIGICFMSALITFFVHDVMTASSVDSYRTCVGVEVKQYGNALALAMTCGGTTVTNNELHVMQQWTRNHSHPFVCAVHHANTATCGAVIR